MSKIALRNITKYYGKQLILNNISLDISEGEFFCITGPSGCGKTTLLRIIAGLDSNYSGRIYFDDTDITSLNPSDRNISMVFQEYALYPNLIARENITFPLRLKKYPQQRILKKLKSTVNMIDIGVEKYLEFLPTELSAGHRQRVATGRAIIRDNPRVFLMDEPLSNLDAKLRMNTKTYLKKLVAGLDTTTIYVTSDSSEAMALADRIGVLYDGRFVQVDSPYDIYCYPRNILVADFFGTLGMNFIYGSVKNGKFYADGYEIDIGQYTGETLNKISEEPELILGIRPEDINFSTKPVSTGIEATVDLIQRFPPKANIRCKFKNYILNVICFMEDLIEIDKEILKKHKDLYGGIKIYLKFNKSKILLFYLSSGNLIMPARKSHF